jgi:hypothetical protein
LTRAPTRAGGENSRSGLRHSWTIGVSRLQVSGILDVIEYSARIHWEIEEYSAETASRPSVRKKESKNRLLTKL